MTNPTLTEKDVAEIAAELRFSFRSKLMRALEDPHSVLPRLDGDDWTEVHTHWQARAMIALLVEKCAQVAEKVELFDGDYLKNTDPRVTIAAALRHLISIPNMPKGDRA